MPVICDSPKVFDAHFHIIHPDFPLIANQGYLPQPFLCRDYLNSMAPFTLAGGVVVSASFQGYDQAYLINALRILGPGFVGITQIPVTVSNEQIQRLHDKGIRGIRFNLFRGGSESLKQLEEMAHRVYNLQQWHVECYVDSQQLVTLFPLLKTLPKLSIDHLGLSLKGLEPLLKLVGCGVKVKASGFGRVDMNVADVINEITAVSTDALMFGSDLPSTRAKRPFHINDVQLIMSLLGDEMAERVLFKNALSFYNLE